MMLRNILSLLVLMSLLGTCGRAQEHEVLRSKTLGGKTGLNHLAGQQSPYLLQHARNPVDWYPWGGEALEKAKTENKLLIISVGYAACHWCHVMEHESFEDSLVAARMNEHFVSIKVDREERPDIDDVYMTACQLTNRRGCGWPLNAIALPDGRPVWAGTYFPKDQWIKVLERFTELRLSEPGKMEEYAAGLTDELGRQNTFEPPLDEAESLSREQIDAAAVMLQAEMDFQRGGTRGSPKFPMPVLHEFLLRHHFHTGNEKSLAAVTTTLDAMAAGGIYDQLAGGFARYSTDADWLVPHFEKMLYDNAQLVSLYAHAYQLTGKERYAEVVRQTLDFIDHDLTDATGVFYASLDADTEGEEGTTYVWSLAEVETIAPDLVDVFGVTERGNWEGQNILTRKQTGLIPESAREKLLTARRDRPQPGLDDKALTAWNALMITGYADAYRAVGERVYRERAVRAGEFLWTNVRRADGRLDRNYKDGKSAINAFLEDYALLAQAYVDLYQITFAEKWLTRARELVAYADAHFYDETTGLYRYTSDLDAALVSGNVPVTDEVIPAGNSAMARVRHQLGVLLAEEELTAGSRTMLGLLQDKLAEAGPRFYANWASLYLELLEPTYEVAILGADAGAKRDLLSKGYLPHVLLLGGEAEGGLSLLRNKLDPEQTTIYVCLEKVCQLPVTEVEAALRQLRP